MKRSKNVFAPVFFSVLLTILAGAAAILAGGAAFRYLPGLNITDPELAKHEPMLGHAPEPSSKRVILVIIDGLRLDESIGLPELDRLRRLGVDAIATSHYPTVSRPNHATLVTGVPPILSGIRNNMFGSRVALDSIMDRLNARGMAATYIADVSPSLGYLFGEDFEALYYGGWPNALAHSARFALRSGTSELVILLPGSVDHNGHLHGADSDEYRTAARDVDAALSAILQDVDLLSDTVIVTADHGHTDAGGHGGVEESVLRVPLILAGAGIRPEGLINQAELADVAPTIAALLGVTAPGHSVGRTLVKALAVDAQTAHAIVQRDAKRIARNQAIYMNSVAHSLDSKAAKQRTRALLFVAYVLVAIILVWLASRGGALFVNWKVLVIAIPAYPLCYYGLLQLLGQNLSFSAIPHDGSELQRVLRFALIATGVQIFFGWFAIRGRVVLRDRLAAANGLVAVGLLIAWIPAGILWIYHGPPPHVTIPGSHIALLIPANYIAVVTYAIGAALLLLLEFIVFFARTVDPQVTSRRLKITTAIRALGGARASAKDHG